ncbi:hypothetical protein CEXT_566001 [Caerostris extrusa]|uniref:Uncharacterized protein n=1 Tax=Caerostris extrusa TaxID=172846 RepID=A0AAV4PCK9_CAEEX|nr:hypothetical protein CEXT_566001 [Caerostris extrusa]
MYEERIIIMANWIRRETQYCICKCEIPMFPANVICDTHCCTCHTKIPLIVRKYWKVIGPGILTDNKCKNGLDGMWNFG